MLRPSVSNIFQRRYERAEIFSALFLCVGGIRAGSPARGGGGGGGGGASAGRGALYGGGDGRGGAGDRGDDFLELLGVELRGHGDRAHGHDGKAIGAEYR